MVKATKKAVKSTSKGNSKSVNPGYKTSFGSGARIKTGRVYGRGGEVTRSHD